MWHELNWCLYQISFLEKCYAIARKKGKKKEEEEEQRKRRYKKE
jgi:hypothetical protein